MKPGFNLKGDKALLKQLRTLPIKVEKKIIRDAIRSAEKLVRSEIKKAAPVGPTANIKKSIQKKEMTRTGRFTCLTVARRPPAFHAHLVEEGTKERKTKDGVSRGKMPANPYFERTFLANATRAMRMIYTHIAKALSKVKSK